MDKLSYRNVFVTQLFGRTVKASIAIDNGRATEFIRRRNYTDKTRCYECGVRACFTCRLINISVVSEWNVNCAFTFKSSQDSGHLSYACPKNLLGEREPPKKKEKKKKKKAQQPEPVYVSSCSKKFEFVVFITHSISVYLNPSPFSEEEEESEEEGEDPALDSLSQAIAFQVKNAWVENKNFNF